MQQCLLVSAGQIRASDAHEEQAVAGKQDALFLAVQADAAAAMLSAINAGNLAEAAKLYPLLAGHRARSRIAVADLLSVGEFMLANGDPEGALTVFRRVISERPGDDQLDRAYLGAGKALLRKARCDTSAWHYFVAAVDLARTSALADEARTYMRKIENCQE